MASLEVPYVDTNILNPPHLRQDAIVTAEATAVAPYLYAGLYSSGSGGYTLYQVFSWDAFVAQWNDWANRTSLRLTSVENGRDATNGTYIIGTWVDIGGKYALWRTTSWDDFMQHFNEQKSTTRLLDFDIHTADGVRYYLGTWGSTPVTQQLVTDLKFDDFVAQWRTLSNSGWRLTKIRAYPTAAQYHLTGVFEKGTDGYALWVQSDWNAFYNYYKSQQATMALVDYSVFDNSDGTRFYLGVWRGTSSSHQFVFDQDWGTFVNRWQALSSQGLRLSKVTRYPNKIELPNPRWDQVFADALGSQVMGYAYCVLKNGQPIAKGVHKARAPQDTQRAFDADSRINLASVSKAICGVAMMKLIKDYRLSLDKPFYPLVQSMFPTVGTGVNTVTIRNLLQMKSGMVPDGTLQASNGIWDFLTSYLQRQNVDQSKRGKVHEYSNTNFTICQAIVNCVTGHTNKNSDYYDTYVSENVLKPMGINTAIFSPNPDPAPIATLSYANARDALRGFYWDKTRVNFTAPGGWISSANELVKFLSGLHRNVVLDAATTELMFQGELGWYLYNGVYGQYFSHNGGLQWQIGPDKPVQGLETGIIRLTDGYDCLLLANSLGQDVISLMIQAFEARMP